MRRSLALTLSIGGVVILGVPAAMARVNVDRTRLPVGKTTASAQRNGLWTCQSNYPSNAPGAFTTGPWFNGDGTWDLTRKASVDGAVKWPNASTTVKVTGSNRVITGNGLPSKSATGVYPIASTDDAYTYDRNPNSVKAQAMSITIPAAPKLNATPQCVGGMVGVSLEGPLIFNSVDAGGRDAVAYELQDTCGGHPERTGAYHYHGLSACADKSKQYGWAFDGLAIWGPVDPSTGNELTNADLDECHGTTSVITIDGRKSKTYHYVANYEYPYTVGCYRATPKASGSAGGEPNGQSSGQGIPTAQSQVGQGPGQGPGQGQGQGQGSGQGPGPGQGHARPPRPGPGSGSGPDQATPPPPTQ